MNTVRLLTRCAVLLSVLAAFAVLAQQQQQPPPATPENTERPEYRARSLPTDTFKPSEKVVEDYPVPFPEDI